MQNVWAISTCSRSFVLFLHRGRSLFIAPCSNAYGRREDEVRLRLYPAVNGRAGLDKVGL